MTSEPTQSAQGQPPIWKAALDGSCPRCGQRTLFDGWVKFAANCRACGLDNGIFNVGDGPAAFLVLIIGAVVTALALTLEFALEPPIWVHVIWLPVVVAGTLVSLRFAKAVLLTIEYRRRLYEGQLERSVLPDPFA